MKKAHFRFRLSAPSAPLPHVWEHTVGSCHAPMALRADWQQQLTRCRRELGFRHVRFHGLLSDDVGTFVRYAGVDVDSFFNADRIVDFLLSIGMKPFVELSFMPQALASGDATVFSYRSNITPPADFASWGGLIGRLVRHWVSRYGVGEVRSWYFEVWNEPNLPAFWAGTQEQYFELYQHAVRAIKDVDPGLRVGGPATAANAWLPEFLDFCEQHRLPADFVSTHHYPNDPLWSEAQDTETELAGGVRGQLGVWTAQARRQARGLPLLYTEWNISSNPRYPRQDEPYAAAFALKSCLEASVSVDAYAFWTFTDLFEESYFPTTPFHGGFGLLSLHGIAKPVYRAFELLRRLGEKRLTVEGSHDTVDAWACPGERCVTVLLANHALPRQPIERVHVSVQIEDAPRPVRVVVERIDETHANAKAAWLALGAPEHPTATELRQMEDASALQLERLPCEYDEPTVRLSLDLPPHSVAAVTLHFPEEQQP